MSDAAKDGSKGGRHRSPNYPAVGLREAVDRVRKLYTADGRAGAPPDVAAKHIGFGSAHGQAMSVLAALKKFGLVGEVSGRLVPTRCAMEILNFPEVDSRRKEALQTAALSPELYRELVEQHRETGLPNAEVLEAELTTDKGFNPKAVAGFVRDFLDTLEYAGIEVTESEVTESEHESDETSPFETGMGTAARDTRERATTAAPTEAGFIFGKNITRKYPLDISIPRALRAELTISGEFRQEDLARLKTQIGRLIDNLEDAFAN